MTKTRSWATSVGVRLRVRAGVLLVGAVLVGADWFCTVAQPPTATSSIPSMRSHLPRIIVCSFLLFAFYHAPPCVVCK